MEEDRMLSMARQEEAKLRSALSQNPDFVKLQQIQRLIAVYETFDSNPSHESFANVTGTSAVSGNALHMNPAVGTAVRRSEKLASAEEWTVNFFKEHGARMQSGEIYPIAESAGHAFGGETPSRSFASFLSNSKRFNNVRGLGYGLAEWGDGPGPKAPNNYLVGLRPTMDEEEMLS